MTTLTRGSISQIYHNGKPRHPIVQVTELKIVTSVDSNAPKRIKCKLSDGEQWGVGMMTSEMAQLVVAETLKQNGCIKLKNYMVNQLSNTKMCIVVDAEVLSEQEEPIGEPVPWTEAAAPEEVASASGAVGTPPKGGAAPAEGPGTAEGSRAAAPLNGVSPQGFRPQGFGAAPAQLSAGRTVPIESLNPYNSRWTIKARVVSKGDKRTYESPKMGPGSVFSFDICDESGEMRVTVWREAADRFFPMVEEGRVYLISKGQLKIANKKYSNLNAQYEMSLGYDGVVQLCADEPASMPKIRYSFVPISEMANKPPNAVVDVIGIVSDVSPVTKIVTKAGKELAKRTAKLADDSGMSIEITIWGSQAEKFPDDSDGAAVAFKGARVTEWNERSLGTNNGTSFEVAPDNEDAARLKAWHEAGGASETKSLSVNSRGDGVAERDAKRSSIADLSEPGVGQGEKPSYVNVLATLSKINPQGKEEKAPWYSSCPKCQKKVVGDESSGFNCDSCGWSGNECKYRYILPCVANDAGGAQWMTAFNDIAEQLLGKDAGELKRLKDTDPQQFDDWVNERQFKRYVMTMRAKEEVYQDKARLKVHVIRANPVNYAQEAKTLLADIAKYELPKPAEAAEAKPMETEEVKAEA